MIGYTAADVEAPDRRLQTACQIVICQLALSFDFMLDLGVA